MNHGRQLRLFLADGTGSGPRYYEIENRTIQALAISASRIKELKSGSWTEAERPGVYLVVGSTEDAEDWLYIGKGEDVAKRVQDHPEGLDFDVTSVILFTSKDANLNGSQIGWLESHLVRQAQEAKRINIFNKQKPNPPSLPKGEEATAIEFLSDLQLIAETAGFSYFSPPKPKTNQTSSTKNDHESDLIFELPQKKIKATGYRSDEGFIVRQGSQASRETTGSFTGTYKALREKLIKQGVIVDGPDSKSPYNFSVDYAFSAPSAASSVINGGASSGNIAWRTKDGTLLKDILEREAKGTSGK